jgi:hypothetical protein
MGGTRGISLAVLSLGVLLVGAACGDDDSTAGEDHASNATDNDVSGEDDSSEDLRYYLVPPEGYSQYQADVFFADFAGTYEIAVVQSQVGLDLEELAQPMLDLIATTCGGLDTLSAAGQSLDVLLDHAYDAGVSRMALVISIHTQPAQAASA